MFAKEKTFDVNKDAKLVIQFEHGSVKCNNWDKNEISVKITAISETSNAEKAEKSFSRINWDVKGSRNEVTVESKLTGNSGNKHVNVSVELEIFMPKTVSLDFNHKFGNACFSFRNISWGVDITRRREI